MNENRGTLRWKFDISAFRLIGRDLITDRVTALFELVKNCYDANARKVTVTFTNVGKENIENGSCIEICDDGFGMTFEDIRDKWMVIGTSSKRINPYTPAPFNRRCVGEKGIGRFAVDKLGDKVQIVTKKEGEDKWTSVKIDWTKYEAMTQETEGSFFTDIDNDYELLPCSDPKLSGTKILIKNIRETWSQKDVERFLKEASRIISPYMHFDEPFNVIVNCPEYGIDKDTDRSLNAGETELATLSGEISFGADYQERFVFNKETGKLQKMREQIKSFGGVSVKLYFFDGKARKAYKRKFPYSHIDGIKIYRDGLITTPFAENEEDINKQRDVLGIEKNRWQDMFDKVSARELIGYVNITRDGNPQIIDATNRQDFVDNQEYRDLKGFILEQLNEIVEYKKNRRNKEKDKVNNEFSKAEESLTKFAQLAKNICNRYPALSAEVEPLILSAQNASVATEKARKEYINSEQEFKHKENIYISIISMQEYAIQVTHAVRTSLSRIQNNARYLQEYFPGQDEMDVFKEYIDQIYHEMQILDKVIDYMLSYSSANLEFSKININDVVSHLLDGYKLKFENEGISVNFDWGSDIIIGCNEVFLNDIFQNVVDNAVKAMKDSQTKEIKISSFVENDKNVLLFSDTGCGIPEDKREWCFGLYNTTTETEGGAGVGLYVVRSRVKTLQGDVFFVDSEFGDKGTTLRFEFPLKKEKGNG